MSYKYKQIRDLARGRKWERLFCELTGAEKGTFNEDVNHHTDVWLDGRSVDVKGLKRSHKKGNVLVEFINVRGQNGWCSPDGADLIAFLFPEGFYVVENSDLLDLTADIRAKTPVCRENGLKSDNYIGRLVGRKGRKDVFTYITKDMLLEAPFEVVEID